MLRSKPELSNFGLQGSVSSMFNTPWTNDGFITWILFFYDRHLEIWISWTRETSRHTKFSSSINLHLAPSIFPSTLNISLLYSRKASPCHDAMFHQKVIDWSGGRTRLIFQHTYGFHGPIWLSFDNWHTCQVSCFAQKLSLFPSMLSY